MRIYIRGLCVFVFAYFYMYTSSMCCHVYTMGMLEMNINNNNSKSSSSRAINGEKKSAIHVRIRYDLIRFDSIHSFSLSCSHSQLCLAIYIIWCAVSLCMRENERCINIFRKAARISSKPTITTTALAAAAACSHKVIR